MEEESRLKTGTVRFLILYFLFQNWGHANPHRKPHLYRSFIPASINIVAGKLNNAVGSFDCATVSRYERHAKCMASDTLLQQQLLPFFLTKENEMLTHANNRSPLKIL